jgi:hypothetical protein
MKIGDYKQMMAYLTRKSFKEGTPDTSKPKPKPLTEDFFKEKADLYIKGLIGGFPQDEMLLKLQGILDKAVEQGLVKPEEGVNYFRNRKQELLDFAKENPGETLPSLTRENFSDGTNPNSLKALEEINKAGALRITEKVNRFKQLVKEDKSPNEAKKIVMDEFNIERNPKAGTPKWMTIGKQELIDEGVKFTESKRGPESTGGKERATKKRNVVTKETQASEKRFVTTKQKMGLGKTFENAHTANIFQAKSLGAEYPVDALAPQTSIQNQVYAEKLNDELKPLYKEQLKLKKAYDENPTKKIAKLIDKNNTAIQNLVASGGKQGKKAANLLRGWNLDVITGEPYLPEGGFNTLKAVDRGMTDTTLQQLRAKTPEDVIARKNYEELLKEMKGKKIPIPEKTTARDMFKNFNERTAPKLKGVLIPGLEEIKEGLKTLPSDIAKKKYFTAGLKSLGIVATPLIAAGIYNDLSSGKSVVETLERNLIGTDIVGSTKDVLALSPEEREARSIVKQNELDKQIAQDFSDLDSDFQTPTIKSKMSLSEAKKEYEKGMSRVKAEREQQEADIARARSINVQALKDLITGERFQPQPIPQQFMANGGRIGFGGGSDMGTVADSQGNVGPGAGGYQGGGTQESDDRSSAAQTAAHNAAVAAAQAANKAAEQKMNIINTLNKFRSDTFVNPYNFSVDLNKNIGPFGLNSFINTLGILGIDDPRTPEDESEQDDYGISAGYNTDLFGGTLGLGAGYSPTTGTNLGLSFYKQFSQGGRVNYNEGSLDPDILALKEKIEEIMDIEGVDFGEAFKQAMRELASQSKE